MDTATAPASSIGFSMLDQKVQSCPYALYAKLHEEAPVYYAPEIAMFVVSKYDDIRALLRDHATFSNDLSVIGAVQAGAKRGGGDFYQEILRQRGWAHVQTLQRTDPPVHTRYRAIVEAAFTASRVRGMAPRIEEIAQELVDNWIDRGECELIAEFALPLPGMVIAEQIGLDASEIATFKRWAMAMLKPQIQQLDEAELRACAEIELEAQHYVHGLIEARRREPSNDLISALVHARYENAPPLSDHELQSVMRQLINGGYETVINAIGHAVWQLIRFPEVQARLRADRSLLKPFVEESLRWESPVSALFRRATRDTEIRGVKIPANSIIYVAYGAANRDAEKFPCPEAFDIDRPNAGAHLAFSSAAHFCLGGQLARQEISCAVNIVLDRLDNLALSRPLPDPVHASGVSHLTLQEMWISFTRRDG